MNLSQYMIDLVSPAVFRSTRNTRVVCVFNQPVKEDAYLLSPPTLKCPACVAPIVKHVELPGSGSKFSYQSVGIRIDIFHFGGSISFSHNHLCRFCKDQKVQDTKSLDDGSNIMCVLVHPLLLFSGKMIPVITATQQMAFNHQLFDLEGSPGRGLLWIQPALVLNRVIYPFILLPKFIWANYNHPTSP